MLRHPGAASAGGRDRQHRVAGLHERERAVLEIGRRIGIGADLCQLLHLECPLPGRGVFEAASEHDALVDVAPLPRRPPHPGSAPSAASIAAGTPASAPSASLRDPPGPGQVPSAHQSDRDREAARTCRSWSPRPRVQARPRGRLTKSAAWPRSESGTLVMASGPAALSRAAAMTATTSGEAPDCEIPITSQLGRRGGWW